MHSAPDLQSLMAEDTIFITPTGSRLYGLDHPGSDYDYIIVRAGDRISTSVVTESFDLRRVDFLTYIEALTAKPGGVFLESLYSERKLLGPLAEKYMPELDSFVPSAERLRRNLHKIAAGPLKTDLYKRVRFSAFTASRWNQWYWSGKRRYDPTLTEPEKIALNGIADRLMPLSYGDRLKVLDEELFFLDRSEAERTFSLKL